MKTLILFFVCAASSFLTSCRGWEARTQPNEAGDGLTIILQPRTK